MISKEDIGKRVRIIDSGDLGINSDIRPFLNDDDNKYFLVLDKITKAGRAIVRHDKQTFSLALKCVEVL